MLRNLATLSLLTLSFGVLALWVRSYVTSEGLLVNPELNRSNMVISKAGAILLSYRHPLNLLGSGNLSILYEWGPTEEGLEPNQSLLGLTFYFHFRRMRSTVVCAPHWFVALILATLAFALKPKPRLRFRLSDLLVLMTFSAMLLAGVAGLTRLAS